MIPLSSGESCQPVTPQAIGVSPPATVRCVLLVWAVAGTYTTAITTVGALLQCRRHCTAIRGFVEPVCTDRFRFCCLRPTAPSSPNRVQVSVRLSTCLRTAAAKTTQNAESTWSRLFSSWNRPEACQVRPFLFRKPFNDLLILRLAQTSVPHHFLMFWTH